MPALTTNKQFLRYAEDEYFSEFMLRAMKPKPGKTVPKTVELRWGQVTSGGKMQMYTLKATGVTAWSMDGEWDKTAVVEFDLPKTKSGISLVMKAPGTLRLACKKIVAERGEEKRYSLPAEVVRNKLLVWGDKELTWNQLREWLGISADYKLYDQSGSKLTPIPPSTWGDTIVGPYYMPTRVLRTGTQEEMTWIYVMWMLGIGRKGHYFSISRGSCDDAAWARIVRVAEHTGPGTVMSGSIRVSSATWLKKWAPKMIGSDPVK